MEPFVVPLVIKGFSMIAFEGASREIMRKPDHVSFSSRGYLAKSHCRKPCVDLPMTAKEVCAT